MELSNSLLKASKVSYTRLCAQIAENWSTEYEVTGCLFNILPVLESWGLDL